MENREFSEEKAFQQFGSRVQRKPFQLLQKSQKLASTIENATAKCEKNYRQGIVAEVRCQSYLLIHQIRMANERKLGTKDRIDSQEAAGETIEQIYDLIPVLRMCRCITPTQEGLIEKDLCFVKASFIAWKKSDRKRLFKGIHTMANVLLENTRMASLKYDRYDLSYPLSLLEKINQNTENSGMDVIVFAGVLQRILEEHFPINEFFLWNVSKDNRFIFASKKWDSFFALQLLNNNKVQIQYRDVRGFFYESDSIANAVKQFKFKFFK